MGALKELFDADAEQDMLPHGSCPRCGAAVAMTERRLDGDSVCAEGCRFTSREAVRPLRDVRLKGATANAAEDEPRDERGRWTKMLTVGEDWEGKLVHGTTAKSAKHFLAGTDLPEGERSKTYSEWGDDVIYASEHQAPHQALMFSSHRSTGAGGKRGMLEFQLKKGSKVLDLSDEVTRRPAVAFGGGEEFVAFKDRPSITDDMGKWLEERRASQGVTRKIDVGMYTDPKHESFTPNEYLSLLKSYAKARGYAAVRLHDETVIVDRSAIESARKMKEVEVEKLRQAPRLRKQYAGGTLYSDFEANAAWSWHACGGWESPSSQEH